MSLARLFRLMDLSTRYTHVFSALASGRSASWAKLVMGETRGFRVGGLNCESVSLRYLEMHLKFTNKLLR